jgi:hypothetical protein
VTVREALAVVERLFHQAAEPEVRSRGLAATGVLRLALDRGPRLEAAVVRRGKS